MIPQNGPRRANRLGYTLSVSPAPSTIGRYEIKRELGGGGMGVLYLALDPVIDRLVAVKLLRVDTEEMRVRFLREARACGGLQHKNIVTIYDVGVYDNQPFIAMEYIKGETLAEVIGRKATLTLEQKLKLIEELCDGLSYAHDAGLIHRDIKPANLMVTEGSGHLKILDFGIARATDLESFTKTGAIVGTLSYMSPEQAQGRPLDHRSDIFAVGTVLYELLTYRRAFPGRDLRTVTQDKPIPVTQLAPSIDPILDEIVASALAPHPDQRYQHLNDLVTRFARVRTEPQPTALLDTNQQQADSAASKLRTAANAAQIEQYLASAKEQFEQKHLEDALAWVNRALDVEHTETGAQLRQRILLAIEDLEKEHRRVNAIERSLRTGRESLEKGAVEAGLRAANEALAYDPNHSEARELKQRAMEAGADKGGAALQNTVLLTELVSGSDQEQQALQRAATRWRRLAASTLVVALSAGTLFWYFLPGPEQRVVAEAEALFNAGQRTTAFAQLEAAPPHAVVTETLAELRTRWANEAEELVTEAGTRAENGDVDGAVAILRDFLPPHDSISAMLDELGASDQENLESVVAQAQALFENGDRQQAFGLLRAISPTTLDIQETLNALTTSWQEEAASLALSARARADNGDLDGAITTLEDFAPAHEVVTATLGELRSRLGNLESARRTVERAAQFFENGDRVEAFRILDEFSPPHELVDREEQRLRQELNRVAGVEVNEARQLAADRRFNEAIQRLEAFRPSHDAITATLDELRGELNDLNAQIAAQTAIEEAQQLAASDDWSRAFARLETFTPPRLVADALRRLRGNWEDRGQEVARQAQGKAEQGDLVGALRDLAQFEGDHPAITAAETQVATLVNRTPPTEPAAVDPSGNVEVRLVALSNHAENIVARFIELYEALDADGMSSIWPTASSEDLAPLAETFKNFRSAEVEHQDCDPELRNADRAVVYCSVAIEYQPVAGARLQVPAVGWQFELEWVDERWQLMNWSR